MPFSQADAWPTLPAALHPDAATDASGPRTLPERSDSQLQGAFLLMYLLAALGALRMDQDTERGSGFRVQNNRPK